ncbi:MAG TPA: TAXI family TRAP transporter solute-binding subunit [Acetobacteraceae bacterium]|nr:TAXI family TRAP transporter solute-binding subunit [Acetobacteraceae bacterium]
MPSHEPTRRRLLVATGVALPGAPALAQQFAPFTGNAAPAPPRLPPAPAANSLAATTQRTSPGLVGVIAGGVDGTYIRIAADLAAVLDDGERLRVLAMIGRGSVQNLADILFLRGVDVGIVQSDALSFVRQQRLFPGVEGRLNYIAKLYDEEVHILARREMARLQDLADLPVNMDGRTSGTAMTGGILFDRLRIPVQPTHDPQDVALDRLRRGDIAAMVFVAGKPARIFAGIPPDSGLHFLRVPPDPAVLETYLPAELTAETYPNLIRPGAPVETIAVGAVMACFTWPAGTERQRALTRFTDTFFDRFDQFLRPPRHPKWREVNLAAQVPGWTRLPAAQAALARARRTG